MGPMGPPRAPEGGAEGVVIIGRVGAEGVVVIGRVGAEGVVVIGRVGAGWGGYYWQGLRLGGSGGAETSPANAGFAKNEFLGF